jgi:putative ABC transport system permease protein
MWMYSLRELQHRLRRVVIAVLVVAVVFSIALAVQGIKTALNAEPRQLTQLLGVDEWVVHEGTRSPFTGIALVPEADAALVAAEPGVREVRPVVAGRATVLAPRAAVVNLVGYGTADDPADFDLRRGRMPTADDEAVVTSNLRIGVGDQLRTTIGEVAVVGVVGRGMYYAGSPTLFMTVDAAQQAVLDGQPYVMGLGIVGSVADPPPGTAVATNQDTVDGLTLVVARATGTIDFVALLTWLVALGVIGAITYLSVVEQTRSFAILRATGAPSRIIVGSLLVQSMVVSLVAALVAVPLAYLLTLAMPARAEITGGSIAQLVVVGLVVGALASFAAARRALTVDPALAFGGA